MQFGVLSALSLLNGALDRQWELHHEAGHVRLDLGQVPLAKVLNCVSHRVGFKHGHSLKDEIRENEFLNQ